MGGLRDGPAFLSHTTKHSPESASLLSPGKGSISFPRFVGVDEGSCLSEMRYKKRDLCHTAVHGQKKEAKVCPFSSLWHRYATHTHTYCHTQLTKVGSNRLLLHTGVVGSHASIGVEFWGVILTSTRSIKCLAFFPLPIPSSVVGSVVRFNFVA